MNQRLDIGKRCLYEGKEWSIEKFVNLEKVLLKDPIHGLIKSAQIEDLAFNDIDESTALPLDMISDNEWKTAQDRFSVLQQIYAKLDADPNISTQDAVNESAKENGISARTIYRWKKLFEKSGQISGLVPAEKTGGRGKARLDINIEKIINDTVIEFHFRSQNPKAKKSYRELTRRCRKEGITPPSENTFRSRISHLSKKENLVKRLGRSRTKQLVDPVPGQYPEVRSPLEVVQIDHTPLDIIVVSEDRKPIGRPWMTLGIDLYSRMVTGFYISFDTPGSLGTGICIANSILPKDSILQKYALKSEWPIHGKIQNLHSDNAPEFKSKSLLMACQEYGMNLNYRPKGETHFGGHIERLLGNFLSEIHLIPGTTFSNTKDRRDYDSNAEAVLTLSELDNWISKFIVDIYHQSVHSTLFVSPIMKFYDGINRIDDGLPSGMGTYEFDTLKVKIDFLPGEQRTIQRTGVQIDHIRYYADILKPYLYNTHSAGNLHSPKRRAPEKFVFKRDPRDLSCIYFLDPKQKRYFPIYYANAARPPMSIWEHREILRELKRRGKLDKITEDRIFEAFDELDKIVGDAKAAKKQALKDERSKKTNDFKSEINIPQHTQNTTPSDVSSGGPDFDNIEIFTFTEDL